MRRSVRSLKRAAVFCTVALLFAVSAVVEAAPRKGQPAPAFKAFALSGQPVSLEGLKGSVVILDFWATWCPPCRESIPFFSELHRKYGKQGLQIVGISVDEGGERVVRAFAEERRIPYPIVMSTGKLQADFGVRALPVLFVLDRNGVVKEQFMGFSEHAGKALENLIKKMLAEK